MLSTMLLVANLSDGTYIKWIIDKGGHEASLTEAIRQAKQHADKRVRDIDVDNEYLKKGDCYIENCKVLCGGECLYGTIRARRTQVFHIAG